MVYIWHKNDYIKIVTGGYSFTHVVFVVALCRENILSITTQYDLSTGNSFQQRDLLLMAKCPEKQNPLVRHQLLNPREVMEKKILGSME